MTPRPAAVSAAAVALVLTGCGRKPAGPTPSGWSQLTPEVQDLTDCAGAVAALGGIDLNASPPQVHAPLYDDYARMVGKAVDAVGATEGAAGGAKAYLAAEERREYWKAQPAPATATRAADCKTKYPKAS